MMLGKVFLNKLSVINPVLVGVVISLSGCTVGPDYKAAELSEMISSKQWHVKLPHNGKPEQLSGWWRHANDDALFDFIDSAERYSPSLVLAISRIRSSRSALGIKNAQNSPLISGNAGASRGNSLGYTDTSGNPLIANNVNYGLDVSWELDLFGGIKRSQQAAEAELESITSQWHDAKVSLAAEVASTYINAKYQQKIIQLLSVELESRKQSHHLTQLKIDSGQEAKNASLSTAASISQAKTELAIQEGELEKTILALVALTGLEFADIEQKLEQQSRIPDFSSNLNLQIPADTISQRPDIVAVEKNVASASAKIGIAKAKALPSISLGGVFNVNNIQIGDNKLDTQTWSFGPSINIPLFTGGANTARIEQAKESYIQAMAEYRRAVINAVKEVDLALSRVNTSSQRLTFSTEASVQYQAYFDAIAQSYKVGKSSLLELESARRQSLASKKSELSARLEQAQSWLALYKALGGGWNADVPENQSRF